MTLNGQLRERSEDFGSLGKELIKLRGRTNVGREHGYGWPLHFPLGITDK